MSLTRPEIRALIGQRILIAERPDGAPVYEAYPTGRIRELGNSVQFQMWYRGVPDTVSSNAHFIDYWFNDRIWTFLRPDEAAPNAVPTASRATSEVLADWERELLEPTPQSNLLNWSVRTRMNEQQSTYRIVRQPGVAISDFENFMVSQIVNDPDPF